jgi:hypothetical protein
MLLKHWDNLSGKIFLKFLDASLFFGIEDTLKNCGFESYFQCCAGGMFN